MIYTNYTESRFYKYVIKSIKLIITSFDTHLELYLIEETKTCHLKLQLYMHFTRTKSCYQLYIYIYIKSIKTTIRTFDTHFDFSVV